MSFRNRHRVFNGVVTIGDENIQVAALVALFPDKTAELSGDAEVTLC